MRKSTIAGAALLCILAVCPLPAFASISIAAGGFIRDNPSQAGGAAIVSTGASIPTVPLELQGSLLVPLTAKGGYAATAEIRGFTGGGYGGAYVGAGAGLGNLSADGSTGTVLTIFAGKSIAPLTSIEFRLYKQTQAGGATGGFAGVRFSF
jgi:hypothetical protein